MGEAYIDDCEDVFDEKELEYYFDVTCKRCGKDGFHWDYHNGKSRLFDAYGNLHVCPQPEESIPKNGVTCKRCGAKGMHWGRYNGTWRLYDANNVLHVCKKN